MSIKVEASRVKVGQSLIDMEKQATNAINILKGIKANLTTLKATINGDADYTAADETEVDVLITTVTNAIKGI